MDATKVAILAVAIRFHMCVPSDGSIGNKALRELLDREDYFEVCNQLIARGILVQGKGKGGRVARVSYQSPETFVSADST